MWSDRDETHAWDEHERWRASTSRVLHCSTEAVVWSSSAEALGDRPTQASRWLRGVRLLSARSRGGWALEGVGSGVVVHDGAVALDQLVDDDFGVSDRGGRCERSVM
jgi:hypothetical protein